MQKILFGATLVAFGVLFGCDQPQGGGAQASAQAIPCHCKAALKAPAATPHVLHRSSANRSRVAHLRHPAWTRYAAADGIRHRFRNHRHWSDIAREGTRGVNEAASWGASDRPEPAQLARDNREPHLWVDGFGRRYYPVAAPSSYPSDVHAELSPWHGWYIDCDRWNNP
jgi:hypothetical protein